MASQQPLVSIVTPVYNGATYLAECVDSVRAQTYENWEYVIVDNCSTDATPEIIRHYASRDSRIRARRNATFVGVIENHNIAFASISGASEYCKVVAADDWLISDCIAKLVETAERSPSVAIVGSHAIRGNGVRWMSLPLHQPIFSGRYVCRQYLLGALDSFGTPSMVLYRSALVRSRRAFFPGTLPNADLAACFVTLEHADFGFVHQLLSFERVHEAAVSASLRRLDSFLLDRIQFIHDYGSIYLTPDEVDVAMDRALTDYYQSLAIAVVNFRGQDFWTFQRSRLEQCGQRISGLRLTRAVSEKVADLVFNPKQTIEKALRRLYGSSAGQSA